eukprot:477244_1
MSYLLQFRRIKNVNKRFKCAVYGYVHGYDSFFPQPIMDIVLCYYYIHDKWNTKNSSTSLTVNEKSVKVGPASGYKSGNGFLTTVVSEGIYSWKFKIINMCDELNFGVRKITSDPIGSARFWVSSHGYAIEASNCTNTSSKQGNIMDPNDTFFKVTKSYGVKCKKNDIILMILDLNECTLKFEINGTDYGVAFSNIEKTKYIAAIFMYAYGSRSETVTGCVELIS